jgi:O-antigen ligase
VAIGLGIVMLPLLNPKGPMNTGPVDLFLGAGILLTLLWAGSTRAQLHVPYAVPLGVLGVAGLVAALLGTAPARGGGAVLQEAFLLAWCAAITSLCTTPDRLGFLLRTWCLSAIAWGAVLIVTVSTGQIRLPGGVGGYGDRARLWFDHPNLAGNYFVISIFVVLAARYPRQPVVRTLAVVTLIIAILLTGSNTALLCLPVGALVIVFLRVHSRSGSIPAVAVTLCLVLAGGLLWSTVGQATVASLQKTDNPIFRYSVARTSRSAEGRESLFSSSFELYQQSNVVGVGPAATRFSLADTATRPAKEAHNDYLGTLVERGPLGIFALIVLAGAAGVRVMGAQRLSPEWAEVVPNPAALAGAAAGIALTALTHEALHYRHFWTLLAVVAALYLTREHEPGLPDGAQSSRELVPLGAHGS